MYSERTAHCYAECYILNVPCQQAEPLDDPEGYLNDVKIRNATASCPIDQITSTAVG